MSTGGAGHVDFRLIAHRLRKKIEVGAGRHMVDRAHLDCLASGAGRLPCSLPSEWRRIRHCSARPAAPRAPLPRPPRCSRRALPGRCARSLAPPPDRDRARVPAGNRRERRPGRFATGATCRCRCRTSARPGAASVARSKAARASLGWCCSWYARPSPIQACRAVGSRATARRRSPLASSVRPSRSATRPRPSKTRASLPAGEDAALSKNCPARAGSPSASHVSPNPIAVSGASASARSAASNASRAPL